MSASASLHPLLEPTVAPAAVARARWVFALLAAQFIVPACSYLFAPEMAIGTLEHVNRLLGGGPYTVTESRGHVWHMLAVGNVLTLGFMCTLLAVDLRRFLPTLPALVFLKGCSAFLSLALFLGGAAPLFAGVAVLDGATTALMLASGMGAATALRRLDGKPEARWRDRLLLVDTDRVLAGAQAARDAGLIDRALTPRQLAAGVWRMWKRLLLRAQTVGTSAEPVRASWRARWLRFRALRLPFLLYERVVVPYDYTGFLQTPEQLSRHVLGAHHQPAQLAFDIELLSMYPGALDALETAARAVIESDAPRSRWLKDLCVFVGYHQSVLDAVARFRSGQPLVPPAQQLDPDLTLRGFLHWCAQQPA